VKCTRDANTPIIKMHSRRVYASPLAIFLEYPTGAVVVTTRKHGCVFIEMDDDDEYDVYGFSIDQLKFTSQTDVIRYCGDITMIETLDHDTHEQTVVWKV